MYANGWRERDGLARCLTYLGRKPLRETIQQARGFAPLLFQLPSALPLSHPLQYQNITMSGDEKAKPVTVDPQW